ncbi:MAG: rhomboid family intramembrane serine protease [Treponema sp.]|nr:rhomboid family intramembrane serine protease [Treponema sp.]
MTKKNAVGCKLKVTYNAPVTLTFVIACTVIMILDIYIFHHLFIIPGSSSSAHPFNWKQPLDYLRLFSHVFDHTDWNHLIANMSLILLLGPIQEDHYGPPALALMMIVTTLVTGVINACFISVPAMGAGDIVFMMIFLTSYMSLEKNELPLSFILVFILYAGGQIYHAESVQTDIISTIAHIAGGLCGSLFAFFSVSKNNGTKTAVRQKNTKKIHDYADAEETEDDIAAPSPRTSVKTKKNKKPRSDDETVVGTLDF